VVHTVLQVIFNNTLACLSSKKIWDLDITRKQKIPLILVLFFEFLTIIATILGGFYRLAALTGFDSSSNWVRAELAASTEISVGVICSSFPAWKQVWNLWQSSLELGNSRKEDRIPSLYITSLTPLRVFCLEDSIELTNVFRLRDVHNDLDVPQTRHLRTVTISRQTKILHSCWWFFHRQFRF
jgi:hypothetical protein